MLCVAEKYKCFQLGGAIWEMTREGGEIEDEERSRVLTSALILFGLLFSCSPAF